MFSIHRFSVQKFSYFIFRDQLELLNAMKFYISIKVYMRKNIHGDTDTGNFRTSATILLKTSDIDDVVQQHYNTLHKKMDEFVRNGTLLTYSNVIYFNI